MRFLRNIFERAFHGHLGDPDRVVCKRVKYNRGFVRSDNLNPGRGLLAKRQYTCRPLGNKDQTVTRSREEGDHFTGSFFRLQIRRSWFFAYFHPTRCKSTFHCLASFLW